MEDDYRVVNWPEFEPKNKTWKGALIMNSKENPPLNLCSIWDSMPQQHWKAFWGMLRVGEWMVKSAFLKLKQIEGNHSSANKKKQALKIKENATAYVAFQKKNNSTANSNQQENVTFPCYRRQGNGPPHHSPLISSPQTCNQFWNYPGWEDPPTPPAKVCFYCGATSHIVKGYNINPANQNAVGQQVKVNFDAFVQKINAWKIKINKNNIFVYSCCVSVLVSSSQSLIQSAFVAKQSNEATALADSAYSNTIVNDPNLTTRNTSPIMTISIKQVNGNLIPVTMQGNLAIHSDLPLLQNISVVPNCEMNLLSMAHMCETWDTSVVLDSDQIRLVWGFLTIFTLQTVWPFSVIECLRIPHHVQCVFMTNDPSRQVSPTLYIFHIETDCLVAKNCGMMA